MRSKPVWWRWFLGSSLGMLGFGAGVAAQAEGKVCEAEEVGRQFAAAGDARDVAALEGLLHPEFRVVFTVAGAEGDATVLTRAAYLGLLKEGKLGGAPRQYTPTGSRWGSGGLVMAGARLEGATGRFESVYTVVRHEGRCRLLVDTTLFTPPKAPPAKGKTGALEGVGEERVARGASMEARWRVEGGVVAARALGGAQRDGWTQVEFELRLVEDGVAPLLVPGEPVYVTLAWSHEDDFGRRSAERVEVEGVL